MDLNWLIITISQGCLSVIVPCRIVLPLLTFSQRPMIYIATIKAAVITLNAVRKNWTLDIVCKDLIQRELKKYFNQLSSVKAPKSWWKYTTTKSIFFSNWITHQILALLGLQVWVIQNLGMPTVEINPTKDQDKDRDRLFVMDHFASTIR